MKATGLPQFQQEIRRILRLFDEGVQWRPAGSKSEPADLVSGDVAQHRKRCLGLGADRVVGIGIDCTDDARAVDDESRRYGKLPCCIPRVLRQIEAEALVSSFEIIRQCEQEANDRAMSKSVSRTIGNSSFCLSAMPFVIAVVSAENTTSSPPEDFTSA